MRQGEDLREKYQQEERGMLIGLLKALFELTVSRGLTWTSVAMAEAQEEKGVRQFFYTTNIETAYWTLRSDAGGRPILECFSMDNESRILTSGEASRLIDVSALLEEVECQLREELENHGTRMAKLEQVLRELQKKQRMPAPELVQSVEPAESVESAEPAESVEPVEPVEPGDEDSETGFSPALKEEIARAQEHSWKPPVQMTKDEIDDENERLLGLTPAERAAEAEEQYSESVAEVGAEFIEDCKAAEAEAEGAGDSVELLDSLPGRASSAIPAPSAKSEESIAESGLVSRGIRVPVHGLAEPCAKPTRGRRRKKKARMDKPKL